MSEPFSKLGYTELTAHFPNGPSSNNAPALVSLLRNGAEVTLGYFCPSSEEGTDKPLEIGSVTLSGNAVKWRFQADEAEGETINGVHMSGDQAPAGFIVLKEVLEGHGVVFEESRTEEAGIPCDGFVTYDLKISIQEADPKVLKSLFGDRKFQQFLSRDVVQALETLHRPLRFGLPHLETQPVHML